MWLFKRPMMRLAISLSLGMIVMTSCRLIARMVPENALSLNTSCTAVAQQQTVLYSTPFGYAEEPARPTEQITSGQVLTITGRNLHRWYETELGWLWEGDDWSLSGTCDALPYSGSLYEMTLPNPHQCYYVQWGIAAPHSFYTDPRLGEPEIVTELDFIPYQAVSRTELWYEIVIDGRQTAWVRAGTGTLAGDCENLPLQRLRPDPPDGICSVYFDVTSERDYFVYLLPDPDSEIVATVPEGVYINVAARGRYTGFRLLLEDGTTGWLIEPDQLLLYNHSLNGQCDDLPVEQQETPRG